MRQFLSLLLICLSFASPLSACNLGMHEWERAVMIDFTLPGPILPAAEIGIINDRFSPDDVKLLQWTGESFSHLFWTFLTRKIIPVRWLLSRPWMFSSVNDQELAPADKTLLINTHSYRLRIILFRDKLSDYRCKQLVLMQEGRMRIAVPHARPPIAEEYAPRTWMSIYFFDNPHPGRIMSLTFAPLHGSPHELYLNLDFIETLLNEELVRRRPQDYFMQYPEGFPLPEN